MQVKPKYRVFTYFQGAVMTLIWNYQEGFNGRCCAQIHCASVNTPLRRDLHLSTSGIAFDSASRVSQTTNRLPLDRMLICQTSFAVALRRPSRSYLLLPVCSPKLQLHSAPTSRPLLFRLALPQPSLRHGGIAQASLLKPILKPEGD